MISEPRFTNFIPSEADGSIVIPSEVEESIKTKAGFTGFERPFTKYYSLNTIDYRLI